MNDARTRQRNPRIMPKPVQDGYPDHLPNFCNLGVMLRILLLVEAMGWAAAWLRSPTLAAAWQAVLDLSPPLQGSLLLSLLALCPGRAWLTRLPYAAGVAATLAIALGATSLVLRGMAQLFPTAGWSMDLHAAVNVIACVVLLIGYFRLRDRALSPALTEARLQALQARIRPHFLFNSLNAVLSLIRAEPARAERALEDLAELYRAMLSDPRQLTPLAQEVSLSRQYLELEHLRLGERLRIQWHVDKMPADALVPPLLLQPLLENAVYHGIEPLPQGGEILVNIYVHHGELHLVVRNPCHRSGRRGGNNMALENIRNRLMLHFDVEASLHKQVSDTEYQVHIIMPCRRNAHA